MSFELKERGNRLFKQGDYTGAEDAYSQAIQKNPREPTFFTNRALTRIRIEQWAGAEHDSRAAINLYEARRQSAMKSYFYLAQSLLGQGRPQEAYNIAIRSYQTSLATKDSQTENLSKMVLRAKQQIWAVKESARLRDMNETLATVEHLLETELAKGVSGVQAKLEAGEIGQVGCAEDQKWLREDFERNVAHVREAFRIASNGEIQERVVPDYLIDSISFEVMHDPVITPSGTSFDRVGIVKYVEQSGVDPITRVPISVKDLRPNYALKAACAEFLDKNGWAVDW